MTQYEVEFEILVFPSLANLNFGTLFFLDWSKFCAASEDKIKERTE